MAEINTGGKGSGDKGKPRKLSTRIDFTPMCDLGFLLITFFMLSTSMSKPQTMELSMPSKDKVTEEEQNKVKASSAVTVILGKDDKVYYYFGIATEESEPELKATSFAPDGIRKVLLQRNIDIVTRMKDLKDQLAKRNINDELFKTKSAEVKSDKSAPVVMIKSTDFASYKNIVDILDEMQICNIGRYAIVDITDYDKNLVDKFENNANQKM